MRPFQEISPERGPERGAGPEAAVALRPARSGDSDACAALVVLSDSGLLGAVFMDRAPELLRYLACRRPNPFSHIHMSVAEVGGAVAGMVLGYPSWVMAAEALSTGLLLLEFFGLRLAVMAPRLLAASRLVADLGADDYYLSNIAVYPGFRRRGVGGRLLALFEEQARGTSAGSGRSRGGVLLDVDEASPSSLAFYEQAGYRPAARVSAKVGGRLFSFLRMAKRL